MRELGPAQLCARPAVHWAPPTLCAPGIFAEPQPLQPTPRTSQLTASSIQGGLFFDDGSSKEARKQKERLQPEMLACAGQKVERDSDAPLQPLNSARANPGFQTSVEGGVFSKAAPTPVKQPRAAMYDHNASSIPGGIFG